MIKEQWLRNSQKIKHFDSDFYKHCFHRLQAIKNTNLTTKILFSEHFFMLVSLQDSASHVQR